MKGLQDRDCQHSSTSLPEGWNAMNNSIPAKTSPSIPKCLLSHHTARLEPGSPDSQVSQESDSTEPHNTLPGGHTPSPFPHRQHFLPPTRSQTTYPSHRTMCNLHVLAVWALHSRTCRNALPFGRARLANRPLYSLFWLEFASYSWERWRRVHWLARLWFLSFARLTYMWGSKNIITLVSALPFVSS